MNRLDEIKDTVEIDKETLKVILHWPNVSKEFDLTYSMEEYYKLLSLIHRQTSGGHGYVSITAATLFKDSGIEESHVASVNLTEKARVDERNKLIQFRDHVVDMWVTDKPELFKDHPHFDSLTKIEY